MNQNNEVSKVGFAQKRPDDAFAWELIESLGQGIAILDGNGRFQYVNSAYSRIVGRSPNSVIGLTPFDITETDDHSKLQHAHNRAGLGEDTSYELNFVRPDKSLLKVRHMTVPRWAGNRVVGSYTVVSDLTHEKFTTEPFNRQQRLIQWLFNSNPNTLFLFDLIEKRVLYQNHQVEAITGYTTEEIEKMGGDVLPMLTHRVDMPRINQHLRELQTLDDNDIHEIEFRIQHKNGSWIWFLARSAVFLRGDDDLAVQIIGTATDITRYKRTEKARQQSEAQYRVLFDSVPDGLYIADPESVCLDANPALCEMLGYTREELIGVHASAITAPDSVKYIPEALERILKKKKQIRTWKLLRKDGKVFSAEISVSIMPDGNLLAVLRDVTERVKEYERQKYEALLLSSISDAVITTDLAFNVQSWNTAAESLYGWTEEEAMGQNMSSLVPTNYLYESREAVLVEFQNSGRWQGQVIQTHKDGHKRYVLASVTMVYGDSGRPISILAINRNITEQKTAEQALQMRESQLQAIIDTVPEAVLLLTFDGSILFANPAAKRFLKMIVPPNGAQRLTHLGNRALDDLLIQDTDALWHEIHTETHIFEAVARPIEDKAIEASWVVLIHDATQEKRLQEQTQRQGRLAAVGQLAAGIAHDFNNIMAVISLYAQLISRTVDLPERARERLKTIQWQSVRATDLIQQILDFSHQSVMERRPLDLGPFIKESIKLLRRTLPENIHITLNKSESSFMILADVARLQQALMNLAVNARDAMPHGGELTIAINHVTFASSKPVLIREVPPGDWVEIQFADSGNGIPIEILPQILEPFFTTKEIGKGVGLGLAQVYGIVQQHDGYIDFRTKEGHGTVVMLYFPLLETKSDSAVSTTHPPLVSGEGETILLVEDNLATREALASTLSFMEYQVIEAQNGIEALDILQSEPPDSVAVVLSDVVMPEMGGIELLRKMREQRIDIPVVLLTGHPLNEEFENLRSYGLAGWLSKPPNLEALCRLLAQSISAQRSHDDKKR